MKNYKYREVFKLIKTNSKKYDYFVKFGYNCFGPLLYSFSTWLKEECKKKNIKKIFFLARDGYIMKEAFELINDEDIETSYFYASRRSIIVPSLWKLEQVEDVFEVIAFKKNIKLKSFLKKVGLDNFDLTELVNKYNLKMDEAYELEFIKNNKSFKNFLNDLFPIIKSNSKEEYDGFDKYIEYMKFSGDIAIVDIGWYGTMQKSLKNIVQDATINGYYMGLVPEDGYYDLNYYNGFLFDKNHNKQLYDKFHYFINIFEFMFLAQHGSVKRFLDNENFVELYEYEYNGKVEKDFAKDIQNGALKFIQDFKDYKEKEILLDINVAVSNLLMLTLNPTYKDAKKFGNILFDDDERNFIAKPKSLFYYMLHSKKFIEDFKNSSWRIGFLKRLLKIKLPYLAINNFLRKVFLK